MDAVSGAVVPGPAGHYYAVLEDWQFGETLCGWPMGADPDEAPPPHPSEDLEGWTEITPGEDLAGETYPDHSLEELEAMPSLAIGQADSLKIDNGGRRVWLSRCGAEDGEPFAGKVTEELCFDGCWRTVAIWRAK